MLSDKDVMCYIRSMNLANIYTVVEFNSINRVMCHIVASHQHLAPRFILSRHITCKANRLLFNCLSTDSLDYFEH